MKWHHVLSDEIIQHHLWSGLAKKKKTTGYDYASRSNYLFTGNIEDRGTC